jgi:UDP-glucose 4-epimerase
MLAKEQKHPYKFFTIGSGKGYSLLEVIGIFEKVNRLKLDYQLVDRGLGDVEQIYADTTKENNVIGIGSSNGY